MTLLQTDMTPDPPDSFGEAIEVATDTLAGLWTGFVANLPLIVLALVIVLVGVWISKRIGEGTRRSLDRSRVDASVSVLTGRVVRAAILTVFLLVALSIAGISVSAVLAGLGVAGLAVAFAVQSILGNFVSGLLLLIRKPFRIGDQVIVAEQEGTVQDVNLRVTKLITYDGEEVSVPNGDVLNQTIVNLTRRGTRRSSVAVGVDYRDDHNAVKELVESALTGLEGVLESPAPSVVCVELGDSSVNFDVFYWTAPQIAEVVGTRDRVVRAVKDAIDEAGLTIPWPIRSLEFGGPLRTERSG